MNTLVKLFGNRADVAYGVLSFLAQGVVERDLVIGYITGVYGLSAAEAKKILTTLSVNGLIIEGVHRDGKYYLKISPMGVAVMNEYSEFEGG
jgi:DNA-binding IclR family transcriptional regulator